MQAFLDKFLTMPAGYHFGHYMGRKYGIAVSISPDGRRRKLYAEELGGTNHISFNLYLIDGKPPLLKPCEMPKEKVKDFVLAMVPDKQELKGR